MGGQSSRKDRSVGIFKMASKENLWGGGVHPLIPLDPPLVTKRLNKSGELKPEVGSTSGTWFRMKLSKTVMTGSFRERKRLEYSRDDVRMATYLHK